MTSAGNINTLLSVLFNKFPRIAVAVVRTSNLLVNKGKSLIYKLVAFSKITFMYGAL